MNQAFGNVSSRTKSLVSEGYGAWPALLTHIACLLHSSPHQASRFQEEQGQRAKAGIRKMLYHILSSLAKDLVRGGSNYNPFTRLQNPLGQSLLSAWLNASPSPEPEPEERSVIAFEHVFTAHAWSHLSFTEVANTEATVTEKSPILQLRKRPLTGPLGLCSESFCSDYSHRQRHYSQKQACIWIPVLPLIHCDNWDNWFNVSNPKFHQV